MSTLLSVCGSVMVSVRKGEHTVWRTALGFATLALGNQVVCPLTKKQTKKRPWSLVQSQSRLCPPEEDEPWLCILEIVVDTLVSWVEPFSELSSWQSLPSCPLVSLPQFPGFLYFCGSFPQGKTRQTMHSTPFLLTFQSQRDHGLMPQLLSLCLQQRSQCIVCWLMFPPSQPQYPHAFIPDAWGFLMKSAIWTRYLIDNAQKNQRRLQ